MFGQSLLSGAFGSAACTTDTDQLFATDVTATSIATYQLNGVTTSIPSNTYPGTASNITYAAGKFDNAAVFNGSSSSISTSYTVPAISTQSISIWFKTSSTGAYRTLFSDAPSNGAAVNTRMQLYITPTSTFDIVIGTNSSYWIGSSNSISSYIDGNWHNIVITYSGTNVKSYIDGSLFQSFTSTAAFGTAGNQSLVFGKAGLNNVNYWNGSIDQVRIFNTALPQSAVTALYNETVATSSSASINYVDVNPNSVAYYKMSSAADQLGNYNGTATSVNFNTEGKFGFAGAFNGSSSKILLPRNIVLNTESTAVSCWVKDVVAPSSGYDTIYEGNGNDYFYITANSSGEIQTYPDNYQDPNYPRYNTTLVTTNSNITDGNWHNVVVVSKIATAANGGGYKIYIDGNLNAYVDYSSSMRRNSGNTRGSSIGSENTGVDSFLNGKIDQIRIYDSAISSANVTALYNEIECPAATVINSFNTVLYTGNGSGSQSINVGFTPDFTWMKGRNSANYNYLIDSVRTAGCFLSSNTNGSEDCNASHAALQTDGFNAKGNPNASGTNYVSWNWKGSGITDTNTDGTITSSVSANKEAGFSVVKATSTGSGNFTAGHGLNAVPQLYIIKNMDSVGGWITYVESLGADKYLQLNTNDAAGTSTNFWNNTAPTSTVFSMKSGYVISPNVDFVAYCFASIPGYSRVGSYNGTSASGNIQYLGFQPKWIIIKSTNLNGSYWMMFDNKRVSGSNKLPLYADGAFAEGSGVNISFDANGFTLNTTDVNVNGAYEYIFLAIA